MADRSRAAEPVVPVARLDAVLRGDVLTVEEGVRVARELLRWRKAGGYAESVFGAHNEHERHSLGMEYAVSGLRAVREGGDPELP